MGTALPLRPSRGGFMRGFGCAEFIRDFLLGRGPYGTPQIDPDMGAPQTDICHHYKRALVRTRAEDLAAEEQAKRAKGGIPPLTVDEADRLLEHYLEKIPHKSTGATYHSFIVYFSNLQRLGWVEFTGREEPSAFQGHYPSGPSRRYFRLTDKGKQASRSAWANPQVALYGSRRGTRGHRQEPRLRPRG